MGLRMRSWQILSSVSFLPSLIQGEIQGSWKAPFSALGTSHDLDNYKEVEEFKKNTSAD